MLVGIPTFSFSQWSLRIPMLFEYALVAHYGLTGQTSIQIPRVRSIDLYKQILRFA